MAGAGKQTITPDLQKHAPVYIAGFGNNRTATAIHDDLWARCIALSTGGKPLVLCGVDSIGLFSDDVEKIRTAVSRELGSETAVVVAATHSHQTPDTMGLWGPRQGVSGINEAYNQLVIERTAAAAVAAVKSMKPASARMGRTSPQELDTYIDDDRPPRRHDVEIVTLALEDKERNRIATLVNWANHPEALGSKNTQISADYPFALYKHLEASSGGVAVFLNGAIGGMQSPLGATIKDPLTGEPAPKETFRFAEILGERIAGLAEQSIQHAPVASIDTLEYRSRDFEIPIANPGFQQAAKLDLYKGRKALTASGATLTSAGIARLSNSGRPVLEIAFVPGELYPELSVGGVERFPGADYPDAPIEKPVKQMMRAPFRMLAGLANDEIGYIIPKAEWDEKAPYLQNAAKRWYGEVNSVGPEAAPRLAAVLAELFELQNRTQDAGDGPAAPMPVGTSGFIAQPKPRMMAASTADKLAAYRRLTFSPTSAVFPALWAIRDQDQNENPEWGQGMRGYSKRFLNNWGRLAVRNTIRTGFDVALGVDSRYSPSSAKGFWARAGHALTYSFKARTDDGRMTFGFPRLAGAYGAGFISTLWLPDSNNSLREGFMRGNTHLLFDATRNLWREFGPDIKKKFLKR